MTKKTTQKIIIVMNYGINLWNKMMKTETWYTTCCNAYEGPYSMSFCAQLQEPLINLSHTIKLQPIIVNDTN